MDTLQAIRLRALQAVVHPDREYFLRKVMRWYSRTFYTPLAQVEELPLEDIFEAYFEEQYAALSPEELEKTRDELLVTEEQRYEQMLADEANEAELWEINRMVAAEEAQKQKKLEAKKQNPDKVADLKHQPLGPIKALELPEMDLPRLSPKQEALAPPGITMTFMDESDFAAEIEGFGTMTQPPKKP